MPTPLSSSYSFNLTLFVFASPVHVKQKPELDYETLLQTLSQSIQDKQQHLSEIKLRERRSTLLVTLYLIAFWIIYAILWWVDYLPLGLIGFKSRSDDWEADEELGLIELYGGVVLLALPAMVGPVALVFSFFSFLSFSRGWSNE